MLKDSEGVISIEGARHNNLNNVDVDVPLGALTVVTGVSGSGKSSLAFDTLYAEGQRRYVESFSTYARQFMDRMDRPDVDRVEGILPAVAIDQKNAIKSSRSTVGTVTEMSDFLKVLYGNAATLYCCEEPVQKDDPEGVVASLLEQFSGSKVLLCFPVDAESLAGAGAASEWLQSEGFTRRLEGEFEVVALEESPPESSFTVVVDRLKIESRRRSRLVDGLETAFAQGGDRALVVVETAPGAWTTLDFSAKYRCNSCLKQYGDVSSNHFSFNSPLGACKTCRGFGNTVALDLDLVVPDGSLSIAEGAIRPWQRDIAEYERKRLLRHCGEHGISTDLPWEELSEVDRDTIVEGDGDFFGVRGWFTWLESKTYKMHVRVFLSRYRTYITCVDCEGGRLNPVSLQYRLKGMNMAELSRCSLEMLHGFFAELELNREEQEANEAVLREVRSRLTYLNEVGLGYLTLDRSSRTLSGGEVQRVNLTTAIGSGLVNTLYVLDEPSVGLHPRDNERLMGILERLRSNRNTVVVIEHDEAIICRADHLIDMGPGPGEQGGNVVFQGPPSALVDAPDMSMTAQMLRDPSGLVPIRPRRIAKGEVHVVGASENNLKEISASFGVHQLNVVTGVSGSGKSTLVVDTLARGIQRLRGQAVSRAGAHHRIDGSEGFSRLVVVDQTPVGKTPRACPATYVKIFDPIRKIYAAEEEASRRGFGPGMFSFNVAGGRCEACSGSGFERIEMQFLSDVYVTCEQCEGSRYQPSVLRVLHQGRSIAETLNLTVEEASQVFASKKKVVRGLEVLERVGLGYLRLGQPLTTLSGGESQRLKIASYLSLERQAGSLFILDEPTTGLHRADVQRLISNLHDLVDQGNTLVVIEHNIDVMVHGDRLLDMGPEGGDGGGEVLFQGTPEELCATGAGETKKALKPRLEGVFMLSEVQSHYRGMTAPKDVRVLGARVHNLKNVDAVVPRGKMVVVTGPSGSGKSSLAFHVIFAEGQRRFIDCLSPYARQYVQQLGRPDMDDLQGVPPTVSLAQRTSRPGPRSTVGTLTEIYQALRLLYARIGVQHCHKCGVQVSGLESEQLVQGVFSAMDGVEMRLLAPAIRGRKGFHKDVFKRAAKLGHTEIFVDGRLRKVREDDALERFKEHDISYVMGRWKVSASKPKETRRRVLQALELGDGSVVCAPVGKGAELRFSLDRYCTSCDLSFEPLDPRMFSFNSSRGACEPCNGSGMVASEDEDTPAEFCGSCRGTRLKPVSQAVFVAGESIASVAQGTPDQILSFLDGMALTGRDLVIADPISREVRERCLFLREVGLDYVTLNRSARSLSGGEVQRVRLAAQLCARLSGVLYVLDEPTIGLHPSENRMLLDALGSLVERGNTVLVVEHDEDTIRRADHVIELGPGGGEEGGEIVGFGTLESLLKNPESLTGNCLLQGGKGRAVRRDRKVKKAERIQIRGADRNNLKSPKADIPVGCLTVVTGPSGSGKSTLITDVLGVGMRLRIRKKKSPWGQVVGAEHLRFVREIDQTPIGRTPSSTPATFIGIFNAMRQLYAQLPESRSRGYQPGRFSFNVQGGRCSHCKGQGRIRHEMNFLPDVYVECDTCRGGRFNEETLRVTYRGKSIADVLQMNVREALEVFSEVPRIRRPLELLCDVGLDYISLGQPSYTLSGGEAQRIKLVEELSKKSEGNALYLMDEPSTGLHMADVKRLVNVIQRLVDRGDTVVVIEHNMDIISSADWVIDMGPVGGEKGGKLLFQGTPKQMLSTKGKSITAPYLGEHLG